jgi:hypothetical protein
MSQEELLKEIRVLGKSITKNRILNSSNPIYTVDKNEVLKWFEKVKDFISNESHGNFKKRLEDFIIENQSYVDKTSSKINENIFQRMRQSFQECFTDPSSRWENENV